MIPNANNAFIGPIGVAIDPIKNSALIADGSLNALVAVDLINGQRVIFSR